MLQRLAGRDKCMDKSCKWRAEYLRRSLVIVYTERGQWQASFIQKLACIAKVSIDFTEISKYPDILGELSLCKQCISGSSFSTHAWEPGNEAIVRSIMHYKIHLTTKHACYTHMLASYLTVIQISCLLKSHVHFVNCNNNVTRNSTSFTRPFLAGRRAQAGHETKDDSASF